MHQDINHSYQQYLDHSHHGHPSVIESTHTGQRGRPAYHIDPDFLQWAYATRSISSISRFLGISRRSVRNAVLAHGLAEPQISPFIGQDSSIDQDDSQPSTQQPGHDFVLDPLLSVPDQPVLQQDHITSFTGPLSVINDEELDLIISQLRQQFTRAGITMLHGMLQQLGYRIPRERIRRSLYRIDPVHRIFGRIRIRRRTYSVAGPNSLWHHDGQHGMFILTCVFVKFY
jgi:hypothetical protein